MHLGVATANNWLQFMMNWEKNLWLQVSINHSKVFNFLLIEFKCFGLRYYLKLKQVWNVKVKGTENFSEDKYKLSLKISALCNFLK
ncbi:hypothetical protein Avbf_11935 [Armadillidium vulgare]|nr:hypothetical protein Avbf_11935 [Armadillidium vulgare]